MESFHFLFQRSVSQSGDRDRIFTILRAALRGGFSRADNLHPYVLEFAILRQTFILSHQASEQARRNASEIYLYRQHVRILLGFEIRRGSNWTSFLFFCYLNFIEQLYKQ